MAERRIKVWMISKHFPPVLGGGAERFRRYAPGLRSRGIDLEVFTVIYPGYPDLKEHEVVDDIPITRIPLTDAHQEFPKLVRYTLNHLQKQKRKPDIVLLFTIYPKTTFDLLRFRFQGIRTVFVSTMVAQELQEGLISKIKNWLYLQVSVLPISRVIASTGVMKTSLISRGIYSGHIRVIPNGVDTKRFRPVVSLEERSEIRRELGLDADEEVIIFVGFVSYRKGIDLLVASWYEIIRKRPRAKLLIVGPRSVLKNTYSFVDSWYDKSFIDRIDKLVADSPFRDRIVFTGEVSNVEVYMRAANVFVFPSRREGMGNVVAEAMATGLPCVLTPYVGFPEDFGNANREYLLSPHDPSALASAIISLLENKTQRKTIALAAQKRAKNYLDVEISLDKYVQCFRTLSKKNQR